MRTLRWPRMSEQDVDAFLGEGGTGVIAFSTPVEEPPYAIPVSYGYVADTSTFHFRLAFPPDSRKAEVVDRPVTFVTYSQSDGGWRSVVATGELEELTDAPYDSSALQERWTVSIPFVDIYREPPEDVTFRPFRLVVDELVGRREVQSED